LTGRPPSRPGTRRPSRWPRAGQSAAMSRTTDAGARTRTTGPGREPADAHPCPHEHEYRRLRDHAGVGGRRWSPIRRSSPARATASGGFSRACEAALMRPGNVRADTHQRPLAVAAPERFGALLATPAPAYPATWSRTAIRPCWTSSGRQPARRRRPPRRQPAHDRDLPRPRSARQARSDRAAVAVRGRDAADASLSPGTGLTFQRERALHVARWRLSTPAKVSAINFRVGRQPPPERLT
jgi:hypothetical protein